MTDKGKEKEKDKEVDALTKTKASLKSSGYYQRSQVNFRKEYGNIVLREFGNLELNGTTIIAGFPSVSLASILTVGYLREQMNLPMIGVISSDSFPPRAIIENGRPSHPIRIYGDKRIVVIICEFKLPNTESTYNIVDSILDFAVRHKANMIVTLEGLPSDKIDPKTGLLDEKLHFISTNKQFSEIMLTMEHIPLTDAVINGVTGLILAEGGLKSVDLGCLLVPAAAHYPEAHGAVNVVKTLVAGLKLNVDTAPLEQSAQRIRRTVDKFIESAKEANKGPASMFL